MIQPFFYASTSVKTEIRKIGGSLQLGTTAGIAIDDPCTATEAGKIIFNGVNFCACDGTAWKRVD